jgi:hypothetical protein
VPASGDSEDDCGEKLECRLAGETEVVGETLPQRRSGHMGFCDGPDITVIQSLATLNLEALSSSFDIKFGLAFFTRTLPSHQS